jgi:hypothetical protein
MKNFLTGKDVITELTAGNYIGYYNGLNEYAGIGCFESIDDIALIAAPDICWFKKQEDMIAVQKSLISQPERFSNRFAILDVPRNSDIMDAGSWAKKMTSSYAAAYYPFIDMTDPLDKTGTGTIRLPPICGCIAATDSEKGVLFAPANCIIEGAVGLSETTATGEQEILYSSGINVLKYFLIGVLKYGEQRLFLVRKNGSN